MKVYIKAKYVDEAVDLQFSHYDNGSVSIKGVSVEDEEPLFIATVALELIPPKNHVFLKGWGENEGIPNALEKAGIVKLTGWTIPTGFVEAQEAILLKWAKRRMKNESRRNRT
ncbi:MAG: hypothetical protein PHG53_09730 [Phycisphaerae bacterium]|nr:hypothetical protein [Phycisphaerae bacterium]